MPFLEAPFFRAMPGSYPRIHPMTTGDWLALGALIALIVIAHLVVFLIRRPKPSDRDVPGWWDRDWDAEEEPWPRDPGRGRRTPDRPPVGNLI